MLEDPPAFGKCMSQTTENQTDRDTNTERKLRHRPPLLRALGKNEPPQEIKIQGQLYQQVEIFKHDSWAATGVYRCGDTRVVCKFNRTQPIGIIPMKWLGNMLARRESILLDKLSAIENVPENCGAVSFNGRRMKNVAAHTFVPGHPLGLRERVNDSFFPELKKALSAIHELGIAYVDLHKRENILVGDDGRPYLIDFQVGFWKPKSRVAALATNWFLKLLQQSDHYHVAKHVNTCRPDQGIEDVDKLRPWLIRVHRKFAIPGRSVRRRLLVWLGIRASDGHASTELNPEVGHRL